MPFPISQLSVDKTVVSKIGMKQITQRILRLFVHLNRSLY